MKLDHLRNLPVTTHSYNLGLQEIKNLKNPSLLIHQRESWRSFLIKGLQEAFEEFQFMLFRERDSIICVTFQPKFIFLKKIRLKELYQSDTFGYNLFIPIILSYYSEEDEITELASFKWLHLGLLPSLTPNTSFLLEGISRAISTQIKKSPGLIFNINPVKSSSFIFSEGLPYVQIVAPRGCWFTITHDEFDDIVVEVRGISSQIPIFLFLLSFGWSLDIIFDFLFRELFATLSYKAAADLMVSVKKNKDYYDKILARGLILIHYSNTRSAIKKK